MFIFENIPLICHFPILAYCNDCIVFFHLFSLQFQLPNVVYFTAYLLSPYRHTRHILQGEVVYLFHPLYIY